jgi:hypothetical protein
MRGKRVKLLKKENPGVTVREFRRIKKAYTRGIKNAKKHQRH